MSANSWLEAFRGEPARAVDDLFSGRAGAGSDLRLDIPEFLYQTFPPNLTRERELLDDALLNWLEDMREGYAAQVARLGFSVYGKRVGDALIALQLLDLPETRHRIRADVDPWLRWLLPLRLAPERDPALECRRLLTRGQPDARHTAMWLRLASDRRSEYLTVALVGLRLLPDQRDDARANQRLLLQALLRHAVSAPHDVSTARQLFNQRYAALRGLFPRGPAHWNRLLREALDGFANSAQERLARELAHELREGMTSGRSRPPQSRLAANQPVPLEEVNRLRLDIQGTVHQSETLARRLFSLLERNHSYAEATGVSHNFVRTLHNLGHRLLQRHQLGETEMTRLGLMIERALAWEPMNPYCWMLWADWFEAQGWSDAREWTLREMLRLFPNDGASRVEMARLLMNRGEDHWDEAEHWLRQALERNPGDEHPRVELARLLIGRGEDHWDEAERWLRQALERNPGGEHPRVELARLLIGRGEDHWDEAERWLRQVVEQYPSNEPARAVMAELSVRRGHTPASESWPAELPKHRYADPGSSHSPDPSKNGGDSANVDALLDVGGERVGDGLAIAPTSAVLEELAHRGRLSGEFAHARIARALPLQLAPTERIRQETQRGDPLAGFYSQWLMPDETPECPPHAWAWRACLYWQESAQPERWRELSKQFPEAARETDFLRIFAISETANDGDARRSGATRWRARYGSDGDTALPPLAEFMHRELERIDEINPDDCEELACTVMAGKAADVPEFTPEPAD